MASGARVRGRRRRQARLTAQRRWFDDLASQLSLEVNADDAVLDGRDVKLDEGGRAIFLDLMRRSGPFCFVAFDLLAVNGRDVRDLSFVPRKKLLRGVVPKQSTSVLYAEHVPRRGRELFAAVCEQDLAGLAKWRAAPYNPSGLPLSWLKVEIPAYSQGPESP